MRLIAARAGGVGHLGNRQHGAYIEKQLFISKNTVATHIRHIYGKLGIHSKEELIDLATEAARK